MGDGRLGGPQLDKADNTEALRRFLLDLDGERKGRSLGTDKGDSLASKMGLKDGFLRFDDPFASKEEKSKTAVQVEQITDLVKQRAAAERGLSTEQKDELRRARRDYTLAKTPEDKAKFVQQIEGLVPGSRELNTKIRLGLMTLEPNASDVFKMQDFSRRSISTIQCHARPEPSYYEQQEQSRIRTEFLLREQVKGAADSFYKPRAEDQFEARWAQIALESPVVKATEALKQLPPIEIKTPNAVDVIKYGLTVSGVEMTAQSKEMVEKIAGGIKSISKEGANQFVIERDTKREILLPEKRDVAAGISIKGIEIDNLRFQIGNGKYPELTNIEGLKVKLEVPAILNKVAQIDNEAKIKRIFMTRNEGTGDFTVNAEVTNPVPSVVRNSLRLFNSEVPVTETIVAPIAVLGPDGKPR
jgi:hypothetical protein